MSSLWYDSVGLRLKIRKLKPNESTMHVTLHTVQSFIDAESLYSQLHSVLQVFRHDR